MLPIILALIIHTNCRPVWNNPADICSPQHNAYLQTKYSITDNTKIAPSNASFPITSILLEDVRINGAKWRIVAADLHALSSLGFTDHETHTIYVDYLDTAHDRQQVILHELFHAMLGTVRTEHVTTGHQFIQDVSPVLQRTLAANPKLVEFLTK